MRGEHGPTVGEEKVADRRVEEMDEIEDVQIDIGRHIAVDKTSQERQKAKPHGEYCRSNPTVHRAVETQIGAQQFAVVIGYRLVHGTYHRHAESELSQHQNAEYRPEQSVQPKVLRPQQPEKQRTVQKRE